MTESSVTYSRGSTRRNSGGFTKPAILCVSALIAFIWSAQFIVSLPLSLFARGVKRSWPIVDYPMYSEPHFLGDEIPRLQVVGISQNGQEIDIGPDDIGGGYWYYQVFARAVARADKDVIRDVIRTYEARHNVRLTAIRVEDRPLLWKAAEVAAGPAKVLRTYPLISGQHSSDLP
jgi:hypothetical protein